MKESIENYRKGIFGALLDVHEKAFDEFHQIVKSVSESEFKIIVDEKTSDEFCRSIQSICSI